MVLPTRKPGGIAVVLAEPPDTIVAFPAVRVLEHLLYHDTVRRETAHERIDVAGVEGPCITCNEILDGDAVRHRQSRGI
jgi:hypothetical protein